MVTDDGQSIREVISPWQQPARPASRSPGRVFGGPTALIEYGGLRFLTDPTFDAPGSYPSGLAKTAPASATPADLGRIDVVLLSHDEHDDNLDASGQALLADVPLTLTLTPTLTTPSGADRLGGTARPLKDWESIDRCTAPGRARTSNRSSVRSSGLS